MKIASILFATIFCLVLAGAASAETAAQISVSPQDININAFYNGTTLNAKGAVPANSHVIVRFIGSSCDLHMKERGKVFGLLWMNLDSLTFSNVPSVCIVSSAMDLNDLSGKDGGADAIQALRLVGLRNDAHLEAHGENHINAFDELLKLKKGEGLYRELVGNVSYGALKDGMKSFHAEIPVPSRLIPGSYKVELAAVADGKIIAQAEAPVTATLVGFPALLSRLAFGSAALYGVLATVIALLSGLAIGMVFQSKGAH